MDIITMKLMEKYTPIPFDVIRYLNTFICYVPLTNKSIHEAVKLWFNNKEECSFLYGHISYWNVSEVRNMSKLFYFKDNFNEDISRWNVGKVKDMSGMFYAATLFNSNLSRWDVSNVRDMRCMFSHSKTFNCDLSNWNVSNVENMGCMFRCTVLFNFDLSN